LKRRLDKKTTQQLIKEQLGWNSLDKFLEGFWLDEYTFIKADEAQLVKVERQKLEGEHNSAPVPIVILNNTVEMVVDKNKKILSVESKEKLGLWLDSLSKIIKK